MEWKRLFRNGQVNQQYPYMIFYRRIFYDDWPFEKALSEPKGTKLNRNWVIDKNEPYIDNRKKKK